MKEIMAIELFGGNAQGLRPDIAVAFNTFVEVKKARVFIRPNGRAKPRQGDPKSFRKSQAQAGLSEIASTESDLVEQIDNALTTGGTIPGFLKISRTLSGAVKAWPYKGAPIVAASVEVLARLIDREMVNAPSMLEVLFSDAPKVLPLAPSAPRAKKSQRKEWVTLSGGFSALSS